MIDSGGNYVFLNSQARTIVSVNPSSGLVANGAPLCSGCTPVGLTLDPVNGDYIFGNGVVLGRATAAGALTQVFTGAPIVAVFSLASVPATGALTSRVVSVQFSGGAAQTGAAVGGTGSGDIWNTLTVSSGTGLPLVDVTGASTPLTLDYSSFIFTTGGAPTGFGAAYAATGKGLSGRSDGGHAPDL